MKKIIYVLIVILSNQLYAGDLVRVNKIPEDIKSIKAVIPIFSQKVSFELPIGWKPAFQDHKSDFYMIEFIPKNESIENWSNLILVQGIKNLSDKITPEKYLDNLSIRFKSICGDRMIYNKIGNLSIDGYHAFSAILGCSEMPMSNETGINQGQSEIGYYISIQGKKDIYLIHKSMRGKSFNLKQSPLTKQNYKDYISNLLPIELCMKGGSQGECVKDIN